MLKCGHHTHWNSLIPRPQTLKLHAAFSWPTSRFVYIVIGVHSFRGLGGGQDHWRRDWVGCWLFDWNGRLLSFNWINGLLGCCSLDWISGLLSILSYKEYTYIHLLVYVRYLASYSQLAHGRVDHVSIAWRPPPADSLGGGPVVPPLYIVQGKTC